MKQTRHLYLWGGLIFASLLTATNLFAVDYDLETPVPGSADEWISQVITPPGGGQPLPALPCKSRVRVSNSEVQPCKVFKDISFTAFASTSCANVDAAAICNEYVKYYVTPEMLRSQQACQARCTQAFKDSCTTELNATPPTCQLSCCSPYVGSPEVACQATIEKSLQPPVKTPSGSSCTVSCKFDVQTRATANCNLVKGCTACP